MQVKKPVRDAQPEPPKEKKLELITLSQPKRPAPSVHEDLPQTASEQGPRMPQLHWRASPSRPQMPTNEESEPSVKYSMRDAAPKGLDPKSTARLGALRVESEQVFSLVSATSGAVLQYRWSGRDWQNETRILEKDVFGSIRQNVDTPLLGFVSFEDCSIFFFFNHNPVVVSVNGHVLQLPETFCGSLSKHAAVINGELHFLSDWNQRALVKYSRKCFPGGSTVQPSVVLLKQICDFCVSKSLSQSCLVSLSTSGWVHVEDLHKLHLSSFEPANSWTSIVSLGNSYFAAGWNQDCMTSHVVAFSQSQGEFKVDCSVRYSLEVGESTQSRLA